jgi:hypothetical protein
MSQSPFNKYYLSKKIVASEVNSEFCPARGSNVQKLEGAGGGEEEEEEEEEEGGGGGGERGASIYTWWSCEICKIELPKHNKGTYNLVYESQFEIEMNT